jgi:hypothetical protein
MGPRIPSIVAAAGLTLLVAFYPQAQAQQGAADRVAAIKQWLADSKAHLKSYKWTQTTVVTLHGDVQSTKVSTCYYDATGTLQREPVSASPTSDKGRELTAKMERAVALVKMYVPPNPLKLQARKDAGKISLDAFPGGGSLRVNFHDYEVPGDTLSVTLDPATNHVLGFDVATSLDSPKDAVTLNVTIGTLPDGTGYPDVITLNTESKQLTVTATNSGYRKIGN